MIYLINTKTKEHIDAMALGGSRYEKFARPPGWVVRVADADGWIELPGGLNECPVPDDTRIEYRMASGEEVETTAPQCKRWDHNIGISSDIIAYRPILDADTKPEPPAWNGVGLPPVGCECECRESAYGAKGGFAPCRTVHKTAKGVILVEFDHGDFGHGCAPGDFRPIRSEEGRAIEAMRNATSGKDDDANFYKEIYRAIRDSKIPGVKLTAADGEDK